MLCVPRNCDFILELLSQAHETVGHFGSQCTDKYIRQWYWWPYQAKDMREFCDMCDTCQHTKPSNKLPAGKHHLLPVPTKPWDLIGMDFIGPFPGSKGSSYAIWWVWYIWYQYIQPWPQHSYHGFINRKSCICMAFQIQSWAIVTQNLCPDGGVNYIANWKQSFSCQHCSIHK